jgi:hypothetical protein
MLRNLLFALIVSHFTLSSFAQDENDYQKIRLGVICSPIVSWANSDATQVDPQGSKIGINIGLMFDRYFAKNYAFATGISVHSMGASVNYPVGINSFVTKNQTYTGVGNNTMVKYSLQYIDIPVALKLRTPQIGYVTIWAQLGFNTMVNIKTAATARSLSASPALDVDGVAIPDMINPFYMGYHIYMGVEYKIIGNTALTAGLGYINGFTDVTNDRGNTTETLSLKNVELRLGILF